MSFDLPASLERDVKSYAKAEHISPEEAVAKLIRSGLGQSEQAGGATLTDEDWNKLKDIDLGFAFFEKMPDSLLDSIEAASKHIRSEKLNKRA